MIQALKLFVYGSLKPGECNAHVLKPWLKSAQPAKVHGTMRQRPDGYPALTVNRPGALGTVDYLQDLNLHQAPCQEGEGLISGFVVELAPGEAALPILDQFEGYYPGRLSEYHRVAVAASGSEGLIACWVYVTGDEDDSDWPIIKKWPPSLRAAKPSPYVPRKSEEIRPVS